MQWIRSDGPGFAWGWKIWVWRVLEGWPPQEKDFPDFFKLSSPLFQLTQISVRGPHLPLLHIFARKYQIYRGWEFQLLQASSGPKRLGPWFMSPLGEIPGFISWHQGGVQTFYAQAGDSFKNFSLFIFHFLACPFSFFQIPKLDRNREKASHSKFGTFPDVKSKKKKGT